jgi:hypothetical protein
MTSKSNVPGALKTMSTAYPRPASAGKPLMLVSPVAGVADILDAAATVGGVAGQRGRPVTGIMKDFTAVITSLLA